MKPTQLTTLFTVKPRVLGTSMALGVECHRGTVSEMSAEKIIPATIEFDLQGGCTLKKASDILAERMAGQPAYKAKSKDFNRERLADASVSSLYKRLEDLPTLEMTVIDGKQRSHPLAEQIYAHMVYLKPSKEAQETLSKQDFLKKGKSLGLALEQVDRKAASILGHRVDLYSVPKRRVGTFCYRADTDGIAYLAKGLNFGLHKAIPRDRMMREVSSIKSAEKFLNPVKCRRRQPTWLDGYYTVLRVAVIGTEVPMLDSADLFPSAFPKVACKLERLFREPDLSKVDREKWNLEWHPHRSGIDIVHVDHEAIDETQQDPGCVRLVMPGGVKMAANPQREQMTDFWGQPIDLAIDFRTLASKGAVALFSLSDGVPDDWEPTLEQAIEHFRGLEQQKVMVDGRMFDAYVLNIPCFRPGQRYTDLCKTTSDIGFDLVSHAILDQKLTVRPETEQDYQELIGFREQLMKMIRELQLLVG